MGVEAVVVEHGKGLAGAADEEFDFRAAIELRGVGVGERAVQPVGPEIGGRGLDVGEQFGEKIGERLVAEVGRGVGLGRAQDPVHEFAERVGLAAGGDLFGGVLVFEKLRRPARERGPRGEGVADDHGLVRVEIAAAEFARGECGAALDFAGAGK